MKISFNDCFLYFSIKIDFPISVENTYFLWEFWRSIEHDYPLNFYNLYLGALTLINSLIFSLILLFSLFITSIFIFCSWISAYQYLYLIITSFLLHTVHSTHFPIWLFFSAATLLSLHSSTILFSLLAKLFYSLTSLRSLWFWSNAIDTHWRTLVADDVKESLLYFPVHY